MPFDEIKNNNPELLCVCGHSAGRHLYCGDHLCSVSKCECRGFGSEPVRRKSAAVSRVASTFIPWVRLHTDAESEMGKPWNLQN
jgi:hypothetical protein